MQTMHNEMKRSVDNCVQFYLLAFRVYCVDLQYINVLNFYLSLFARRIAIGWEQKQMRRYSYSRGTFSFLLFNTHNFVHVHFIPNFICSHWMETKTWTQFHWIVMCMKYIEFAFYFFILFRWFHSCYYPYSSILYCCI